MTVEPQPSRSALQQRVAAVILDAAARMFAVNGEQANMHEVAEVAGVGRATLYRYFPNRQALWREVADAAVVKVGERLAAARLDAVAMDDGVTRAVRALIEVGDYFVVLAQERAQPTARELDPAIAGPLDQLFDRGQSAGLVRSDIPSSWLRDMLVAQVVAAVAAQPALGIDDAINAVSGLFLDGARLRGGPSEDVQRAVD